MRFIDRQIDYEKELVDMMTQLEDQQDKDIRES